jgi:hypothetical protein
MEKKRNITRLGLKLLKELRQDILMRYDSSEYWDYDVIERFYQDNKLTAIERGEVDKFLSI